VGDDHELRLDAHFLDEVGEAADVGFVEDAERAGRELEDGGRVAEPLISAGTTTDAGVPRLLSLISSIQSGQRVPHPCVFARVGGYDADVMCSVLQIVLLPPYSHRTRKDGAPFV